MGMKYDPKARPFWEEDGGPISSLMDNEERIALAARNEDELHALQWELYNLETRSYQLNGSSQWHLDRLKRKIEELGGTVGAGTFVCIHNKGAGPCFRVAGGDGNGNRRIGHGSGPKYW